MQTAVALLFAVPLFVLTLVSCWRRRASLTLADGFLVAIAMFFGAYTIVDVSLVDAQFFDEIVVLATFVQITLGAWLIYLYGVGAPSWVRQKTSLGAFFDDLLASKATLVILILLAGVAFRIISAEVIGEFEVQNADLLEKREADLPYWFKACSMLLPMMVLASGLSAGAKAFASGGRRRLWWAAWSGCGLWFFFGFGRRALLAYLLVLFWMYIRGQRRATKIIISMMVAVPLLLGASNMFQQYRQFAHRGVLVQDVDLGSLFEAVSNFDLTSQNLQEREAIWRFNATVIQSDAPKVDYQWGTLLTRSVGNFIPSALTRYKTVFDSELELERLFHIEEVDKASNVFVMAYGDFGPLSFVIAPAMVILFLLTAAWVLRHLKSPHLRALLMASCLYYALNIEADYAQPIQLARDFLILAVLHWSIAFFGRLRTRTATHWYSPASSYRAQVHNGPRPVYPTR